MPTPPPMYLDLTDTHRLLKESLARYLADRPGEVGRYDREVWSGLARPLELLGAGLPEECGGLGAGILAHAVIMGELGRALRPVPYLASVVMAGGLLARSGLPAAGVLLSRVIDGADLIAVGLESPDALAATRVEDGFTLSGHKQVVRWAPDADWLIVSARVGEEGEGVFVLRTDAPGLSRRDYATLDGVHAADLAFDAVEIGAETLLVPPSDGQAAIAALLDEAVVCLCAEAVGVMREMIDQTVAYARTRHQFGVPIGSFQALQHLMVDMAVALEQADAATAAALLAIDRGDLDSALLASAAKVQAGKACRLVGQSAIQVHGGMGIAEETPIGRYFKRSSVLEIEFGTVDHHLRRYARLSAGRGAGERSGGE